MLGAANSSPTTSALFKLLETCVHEIDSRAAVAAFLDQGYTESQMYRRLGIQAYGFNPIVVSPEVNATKHGVDERVPVRQYREALPLLYNVVRRISSQ